MIYQCTDRQYCKVEFSIKKSDAIKSDISKTGDLSLSCPVCGATAEPKEKEITKK